MKTRFNALFAAVFTFGTMFFLTGCRVGGNMSEVFRNAKGFSIPAVLILVMNVYFMYHIIQANRSLVNKVLWIAVIWFMPVVGALIYWFISHDPAPKKS